jgi:hypothetical protein
MAQYRIRAGTSLARAAEPLSTGMNWSDVLTAERDTVFDHCDLVEPWRQTIGPPSSAAQYHIFRLPQEAMPYTYIMVLKHLVTSLKV